MDDPTLDTLMVLIAELHRAGIIDAAQLSNMGRRLDMSGLDDLAERVRFIPLSNAMDNPKAMQASLHLISGGGNDPD